MNIQYKIGDATAPIGEGNKLIVHCCNDIGAWGAGFVIALSRRWLTPQQEYTKWCQGIQAKCEFTTLNPMVLGEIQIVNVEPQLYVCNLIGQHGVGCWNGIPLRYEAIAQGLRKVASVCLEQQMSVHMPRIGAGLAGGDWRKIAQIIQEELVDKGVEVIVYDLQDLGDVSYI